MGSPTAPTPPRPGSAEPFYRQLADHVRRRVASGQIKAGDEIPLVRQMAQLLAVSAMTISKANGLLTGTSEVRSKSLDLQA